MATEQQIKSFIEEIAPCAQYAYKTLGKVLPSVCIGMACVESGYGTAGSVRYHSYFGQKVGTGKTATKYWGGKSFNAKTKEEYSTGVAVIRDNFRAYDSMQQSTLNFYELLNTSLYKGVQHGASASLQMLQIKACGYMTSSTEVNSVLKIIEKYNLTKYDDVEYAPPKDDITPIDPMIKGYTPGKIYTLQSNMYVRKMPNGQKVKFDDLTDDGKKHGHFDDNGDAILDAGTRVTCKEVREDGLQIWLRIPSGWVCAVGGKTYII